jgi:hypothetical protein
MMEVGPTGRVWIACRVADADKIAHALAYELKANGDFVQILDDIGPAKLGGRTQAITEDSAGNVIVSETVDLKDKSVSVLIRKIN